MSWIKPDLRKNSTIITYAGAKINVHVSHKKVETGDFGHKSTWGVALGSKFSEILWHSFYLDQMDSNCRY